MSIPANPVRGYSFTGFSTSNPSTPQPGVQIDGEIDRTNTAVSSLIGAVSVSVNADGTLKTSAVQAAYAAGAPPPGGVNIADAPSAQSANTAQAWAEYLPGTLPADKLAGTAVTGDHWSARWWANQAATQVQAQAAALAAFLAAATAVGGSHGGALPTDIKNIVDCGAVADGKKAVTNISVAVGSDLLNVSTAIFAAGDVGKILGVVRTDVYGGFNPWWGTTSKYIGHVTITQYLSPTQVRVSLPGSASPTGLGSSWPAQSWPYASTPGIVVWGTNNAIALQAAFTLAAASGGGRVFIPAGNFCLGEQSVMASNTELVGVGAASQLWNVGVHDTTGAALVVAPIVNTAHVTQFGVFTTGIGPNQTPTKINTVGDRDLTLSNFAFDCTITGSPYGGLTARFLFCRRVTVSNIKVFGVTYALVECPDFIGCDDVEVADCEYMNVGAAFTPWGGCTNIRFHDNTVTIPYDYAPSTTFGADEYSAVQINVVGTIPSDYQQSADVEICDNTIYLNGGVTANRDAKAVMIFPDGAKCSIQRARITGNHIVCAGNYNWPIFVTGSVDGLIIEDNIVDGCDGLTTGPVKVTTNQDNTASYTAITGITVVNGSALATINWPAHGYPVGSDLPAHMFFFTNGGVTAGGVGIGGWYDMTDVPTANTITIRLPSNAASSQTVAWNGAFSQINSASIGVSIARNQFKNCASPGIALIFASAGAFVIDANHAHFTPRTLVGNYLALVEVNQIGTQPLGYIVANTGPDGTGSIGGRSGNNRVCYNAFAGNPFVIDYSYDATNPTLTFSGPVRAATPPTADNSTLVATTAHVKAQFADPQFTGTLTDTAAALGGLAGNTSIGMSLFTNTGSNNYVRSVVYRNVDGASYTSTSTRLEHRIDTTQFGFIEYNPPGYLAGGVALGVMPGGVATRAVIVEGNGTVNLGVAALALNVGTPTSSVTVKGTGLGFYGKSPTSQAVRPVTLADVISVLVNLGLTA